MVSHLPTDEPENSIIEIDVAGPFSAELELELLKSLRSENVQGTNTQIRLAIRDDAGRLECGLEGSTSYGWLHINLLWVTPSRRGKGDAKALLNRAYEIAIARGCHAVWLETSSPSAAAFYRHVKFELFGQLENQPAEFPLPHSRWFLKRTLP